MIIHRLVLEIGPEVETSPVGENLIFISSEGLLLDSRLFYSGRRSLGRGRSRDPPTDRVRRHPI